MPLVTCVIHEYWWIQGSCENLSLYQDRGHVFPFLTLSILTYLNSDPWTFQCYHSHVLWRGSSARFHTYQQWIIFSEMIYLFMQDLYLNLCVLKGIEACICVMLVVFPQSPLLCGAASSSILLWQLSGTPQGACATHSTTHRVYVRLHVHSSSIQMPACARSWIRLFDSHVDYTVWALTHPHSTHKPHEHKYSHALLTLTWAECQQPSNANEICFPAI